MNVSLPSAKPLRILVTRADRIGDLVLSTSVFPEIRKRYPDAWIGCLTFAENQEILQGNPFIDEVIAYRKKDAQKGLFGNLWFALALAKKKYDVVIHLHATNRMHLVSWLAHIPVRIGYDRKMVWALTHRLPDHKKEGLRHEADYNFDLLQLIDVAKPKDLKLFFPLNQKAAVSFDALIRHLEIPTDKPWIVFHPAASCPSKVWPSEKFGQLGSRISEQKEAVLIVIGTRGDRNLIAKMKQASSATIYDLSGRLSLAMLGALLRKAAILISNDSGPVHIAAALGTPVVSIFGRNQPGLSPVRWRPLSKNSRVVWKDVGCAVCLAHLCQIHFLCLQAISVEEVYHEVNDLLSHRTESSLNHAVTA